MTTASKMAAGKSRMLCQLLACACVFVILHATAASNVVSFDQQNKKINADVPARVERLLRSKRSVETDSERNDNKCDSQKEKFNKIIAGDKRLESTHVFKDETKFSLALAWAGENDDGVLVVLTSRVESIYTAESTLWRSIDFGRHWKNISESVQYQGFRRGDGLQRNPHNPKWLYLVSYQNMMYTSEDGGETWTKVGLVDVVKGDLIFHESKKYKDHIMFVTSHDNKLVMTRNNFRDMDVVKDDGVVTAKWGSEDSNTATQMFITYGASSNNYKLFPFFDDDIQTYKLQRRPAEGGSWKTIRDYVVDFGLQGDFLYASVYTSSKPAPNSERLLIVSNDGGDMWNEAQLPTITRDRFFSVLDMSEHLIFMHVDNPGDTGHGTLYTSWSKGIFYSKSMERHLYPNYNSITDFYKVESMPGTYIASQLSEDNSIHSRITFDLGGEWQPLAKPADIDCKEGEECSLQIHNSYSIHRGVKAHPPYSTKDAIGLIIANAHVAKNLQTTDPDVFVSSDGGYSWRKVLDGPHSYIIADSGGLIVAISMEDPFPQEVKFSMDEGRCWHVYKYTEEKIHHTGLLTEPGGKSMTVALWGYREEDKKWTIHVIDFADVVSDHCRADDYEDWVPHESLRKEDPSRHGCLLGTRITYQRLKHDSWCHNGYEYTPKRSDKICPCAIEDFECDFGYYRPDKQEKCIKDPNYSGPEIDVCFRGHEQKVISEGYRKLPGDVCSEQEGFKPNSKYINLTQICDGRIAIEPKMEEEGGGHKVLVIALFFLAAIILSAALAYFGYKMVLLRRHKVVYRYSMLNQTDDKDFDEEIERTLTGSTHVFGEMSDEEELPADPRQNGHVQKGQPKVRGYHDDSDDDMLD
ncbi:sortilin-like [Babylonia areolata]|uniref:sortilin-like n=1 Tax=Babylonia areolata TaxID=304850 RepID=UPI003FD5BDC0